MNIAQYSVKNSLLVNLISVLIIIIGIISMAGLKRDAFPQVDYDTVTVTTSYAGASTEDVEKLVTIPLEKEIRGINGIDKMTSTSEEGLSRIGIYIEPSASDKDQVVTDIQRAVDRVQTLPAEVDDPVVFELRTRDIPVIEVSVSGMADEMSRRQYAETLEDRLLDISGVASVSRIGWRDPEFWVEVDPEKMRLYHVTFDEIRRALANRNVTVPGGQLEADATEFNIRTTGEFQTAEEIGNVIIRANDAGNWLRVKDIATVSETFEEAVSISKIDGGLATTMVIIKKEAADTLKTVDAVHKAVEEFKAVLPDGMAVSTSNDFAYYVKRRLGVLKNNGIIGFILVVLILFFFLDRMPALLTAFGIPIALFMTFAVMHFLGITINLISMLGLIIVLGMLVDDGIIVSENVYRYMEEGMPPREAVIRGTSEVAMPVTVTILTTVAAFSPLLMMSDIVGKFVREVPIVVIIALTCSLFEAFIILPSHMADFVRIPKRKKEGLSRRARHYQGLLKFYTGVLGSALKHRYIVICLLGLFFGLAISLVALRVVKYVPFTGEGIEYFFVRAEAPKGTTLEGMDKKMRKVEEIVAALDKDELDNYRTFIGAIEEEAGFDPDAKRGSHLAQIIVYLTPLQQRDRLPDEIMEDVREQLKAVDGFEKLYLYLPREGPPTGKPVEIGIKGEDFSVSTALAGKFSAALEAMPGVTDVNVAYDYGKKLLNIKVDEEQAKRFGLSVGQIASAVRTAFKGAVATSIKPSKAEEEIDVLVRLPESLRRSPDALDQIMVENTTGNLIPLSRVARFEEKEGIYRINHLDGKRVVYVSAQVDDKQATSFQVNADLQKQFRDLGKEYLGYTIKYGGSYAEQRESNQNLIISGVFALGAIFIILVAVFRSLLQPFIIVSAIPFGLMGVIFAFFLHGRPLGFLALMGVVGLIGVVVNDSIVLVDFVNRLRKEGKPRRESLIEAGRTRLRPILMTSITTVGGLISVAYGIGGGDPFLKPMALAIMWGLVFSTILILVGIPCLYAALDDVAEKTRQWRTKRKTV